MSALLEKVRQKLTDLDDSGDEFWIHMETIFEEDVEDLKIDMVAAGKTKFIQQALDFVEDDPDLLAMILADPVTDEQIEEWHNR